MAVKLSGKKAAAEVADDFDREELKRRGEAAAAEVWEDVAGEETTGITTATEEAEEPLPPHGVGRIRVKLLAALEFDDTVYPAGECLAYLDEDDSVFIAKRDPAKAGEWDEWNEAWLEAHEFELIEDAKPEIADDAPQPEPASPPPATPPVEECTAEQHHEKKRAAIERVIGELSVELANIKSRQKSVKKKLDGYVDELADLEDKGPEPLPLFDASASSAGGLKPGEIALVEIREEDRNEDDAELDKREDAEPAAATDQDDSWKETPIEELDLSKGIIETLLDNSLQTVGKLADFTAKLSAEGHSSPLTTIPKIGQGKAEKIEAALAKFWAVQ